MEHSTPVIRNPKFWVPSLYLAQGLPFFAVMIVANQMLKSMGVPNDELNHWTGLIGFAWVFKPLWSPFLELASSKTGGGRIPDSGRPVSGRRGAVAAYAVLVCCRTFHAGTGGDFAATHDIACDGLYITSLDEKGQAQYAGWTGTFFNAGKFFTTGGLLLLAGHFEKP
jgi:PAT family beta-lactamase induction signal transducer AmpG